MAEKDEEEEEEEHVMSDVSLSDEEDEADMALWSASLGTCFSVLGTCISYVFVWLSVMYLTSKG